MAIFSKMFERTPDVQGPDEDVTRETGAAGGQQGSAEVQAEVDLHLRNETEVEYRELDGDEASWSSEQEVSTSQEVDVLLDAGSLSGADLSGGSDA
jgi:hypothetical protein